MLRGTSGLRHTNYEGGVACSTIVPFPAPYGPGPNDSPDCYPYGCGVLGWVQFNLLDHNGSFAPPTPDTSVFISLGQHILIGRTLRIFAFKLAPQNCRPKRRWTRHSCVVKGSCVFFVCVWGGGGGSRHAACSSLAPADTAVCVASAPCRLWSFCSVSSPGVCVDGMHGAGCSPFVPGVGFAEGRLLFVGDDVYYAQVRLCTCLSLLANSDSPLCAAADCTALRVCSFAHAPYRCNTRWQVSWCAGVFQVPVPIHCRMSDALMPASPRYLVYRPPITTPVTTGLFIFSASTPLAQRKL